LRREVSEGVERKALPLLINRRESYGRDRVRMAKPLDPWLELGGQLEQDRVRPKGCEQVGHGRGEGGAVMSDARDGWRLGVPETLGSVLDLVRGESDRRHSTTERSSQSRFQRRSPASARRFTTASQ